MTEEEDKEAYKALDHPGMKEKSAHLMLSMCRNKKLNEDEGGVFHEVKEMFTTDELAYMSCCYLGMELKKALESPMFKMLVQLLRMAEEATESNDKDKQVDIVKQVMDLLKN